MVSAPKKSGSGRKSPEPVRTGVVGALGGRRETLEAVRLVLAKQLDDAVMCRSCQGEIKEPPAGKAATAKELRAVLAEIAELSTEVVVSGVDDIAARREARLASAVVAGSSVRRVRQRNG